MKYAYIHTNGNDMVLLPNGTWAAIGRDLPFSEYASGSAEDRDAWNGSELWEDFAESIQAAADKLVEEGAELVAYYDGDKFVILDDKRWEERCNFHRVTK
ncbi:hypothetical protein [Paenibacillus ginsengihumi]|uniref:hypothetical protein n=1 Tax=Paenibacillus ginsengihumi TaxID=431596 RepID=UPI00037B3634|nr:hypothetical protein [Paenibacillus ginsengihumi]